MEPAALAVHAVVPPTLPSSVCSPSTILWCTRSVMRQPARDITHHEAAAGTASATSENRTANSPNIIDVYIDLGQHGHELLHIIILVEHGHHLHLIHKALAPFLVVDQSGGARLASSYARHQIL